MSRPHLRLLICGFGGFPGFPDNPAAQVVASLRAQDWSPEATQAQFLELPTAWSAAVETVADRLRQSPADAVLVVGVAAGAQGFRVEMQGRNRARTDLPDAVGVCHPHEHISASGPAMARATAPVEPMLQALLDQGLPAAVSSDAGDYLCNYVFYRLLTEIAAEPAAPLAAFLHIPPHLDPEDLERGVKAAAAALARAAAVGGPAQPVTA